MHKAQVLKVRGDSLQLVGKTKGQMRKVAVEGTLGELYFVEHLSVETHSTYNLTRSIMRRRGRGHQATCPHGQQPIRGEESLPP